MAAATPSRVKLPNQLQPGTMRANPFRSFGDRRRARGREQSGAGPFRHRQPKGKTRASTPLRISLFVSLLLYARARTRVAAHTPCQERHSRGPPRLIRPRAQARARPAPPPLAPLRRVALPRRSLTTTPPPLNPTKPKNQTKKNSRGPAPVARRPQVGRRPGRGHPPLRPPRVERHPPDDVAQQRRRRPRRGLRRLGRRRGRDQAVRFFFRWFVVSFASFFCVCVLKGWTLCINRGGPGTQAEKAKEPGNSPRSLSLAKPLTPPR